jgi:hypothetical protein
MIESIKEGQKAFEIKQEKHVDVIKSNLDDFTYSCMSS